MCDFATIFYFAHRIHETQLYRTQLYRQNTTKRWEEALESVACSEPRQIILLLLPAYTVRAQRMLSKRYRQRDEEPVVRL